MFPRGAVFTFRVLAELKDGVGGVVPFRVPCKEDCLQRRRPHTWRDGVGGSSVAVSRRRPRTLKDGVGGRPFRV